MSEISDDDRTTALGLFNYARSYKGSADFLLSAELRVTHPHAPLTFLFYHAIELYLKSYLRALDYTVSQLRSLGHNISKLAIAVEAAGLILDDEDKEVLQMMAEADNVIRSRYIQTGAFSRPEEEALSRTCSALDELISRKLIEREIKVRPETAMVSAPKTTDQDGISALLEEFDELTKKEREIISYLLHHNQRMFTADLDGGHAATLISRGIVQSALRPGQVFDASDTPMEIPRSVWTVLKTVKDQFPYDGQDDDPYPWRVHWMSR